MLKGLRGKEVLDEVKEQDITREGLEAEKERINDLALERFLEAVKSQAEEVEDSDIRTAIINREDKLNSYDTISMERIIGNSDLFPISYLQLGIMAGESVCRISIRDNMGRIQGYGTGFLVSPTVVLTNNHVIKSEKVAINGLVEFNYQDDENFMPCATYNYRLDPERLFITDEDLDFTLVAVKENIINGKKVEEFGYLELIPDKGKVIEGECVSIIQHPKGGPKCVTIRENEVRSKTDDFIHYITDTEPGSSGSPVFNDQWTVVALHHSGVPDPNEKGAWIANEGVRISSIAEHVNGLYDGLTEEQKRMIDEIFPGDDIDRQ